VYKLSINKELFDNILLKKINILEKHNNNYWKKELLEPAIIDDKVTYTIKQFEKLQITNGLGKDKPQLIIECKKVDYDIENGCFEFYLGKILEQKNINIIEDEKDIIIKQLLEEREKLLEMLNLKK
jgi:hypothetical protein